MLLRMSEELWRAMQEPATRAGWEFEPGRVDLILREVGDEPGALGGSLGMGRGIGSVPCAVTRCRRSGIRSVDYPATSGLGSITSRIKATKSCQPLINERSVRTVAPNVSNSSRRIPSAS